VADDAELSQDELDIIANLPSVKADNAAVVQAAGLPSGHFSEEPEEAPRLTAEDLALLDKEQELQDKYGNAPLTTFAETTLGEASFGLTDRLAQAVGLTTKEAQKERAERNEMSKIAGEVTGIIAPAVLSGGTSAAAKGAATGARAIAKTAQAAEKVAAKVIESAVAQSGSKKVSREVIKKSIEKAAGAATEGALYSAGHLAREDAIGTADFNAENVLTSVGTGALLGGITGAVMPSISSAASKSSDTAKALFGKGIKKYADPVKAAEEFSGLPVNEIVKLKKTESGRKFLEDLPAWYKNDVKLAVGDFNGDDVVAKVIAVKNEAGETIERVLKEADSVAAQRMGSPANAPELRKKLINDVADEIEQNHLAALQGKGSNRADFRKIKIFVDDIRSAANKGTPLTATELIDLKRWSDDIAGMHKTRGIGATKTALEDAATDARRAFNEMSKSWVTLIDDKLAAELSKANRNYHYAAKLENPLMKKAERDKSFIGFKDALYGAGGVALGEPILAAAYVGARKFADSDLRRRLVILNGLETAQAKIAKDIGTSVKDFLAKGARPGKLASITALTNATIAQKREEGKQPVPPKNRKEAYKNAAANVSNLLVNSDQLMDRAVKAGAALSHAAPQTAEAVGRKAITALQFLQSKIPKNPYETIFPSGKTRDYEPSSMELAKFERYVQVVDNPLSVLQDLKAGTLTREHVEALQAVYPDLYSRIQQAVLGELKEADEADISYSKKVQIGMLLNIPTDESLLGKNIAGLQDTFTPQEEAQAQGGQARAPSSAGKGAEFTASERASGDSEAFLRRRNGE